MTETRQRARKLFRLLLAFVALLAIILGFNTVRSSTRQIVVTPAKRIEIAEDDVLTRFGTALSIKTISHENQARFDEEEFSNFQQFLEDSFPLTHQQLKRMTGEVFGDERNRSLLFKWEGSDSDRDAILLMAHYDVVPVPLAEVEDWTLPPFSGDRSDGFVWGRGAIDDKCSLMGIMEAVEYLLGQGFKPAQTIYLSFGHDEEIGGTNGNKPISEWMRQEGIRLDYVLDEGGGIFSDFAGLSQPAAFIGVGEKGFVTVELSVDLNEAGHSSMPPALEDTAVGILGEALHRLNAHPHPASLDEGMGMTLDYLGPEMPLINRVAAANRWLFAPLIKQQLGGTRVGNAGLRTTMAPTIHTAGEKENVLPSQATLTINLRILHGDTVESAIDHIAKTVDDERIQIQTVSVAREPSRLSSTDSDSFTKLNQTIREIYPSVVVAPFIVVASTDASHYDDDTLSRNVYHFVPWQLGKEDLKSIHGINERLSEDDFIDIIRFYERLIRNTAAD